jgi:hypothetical protein
VTKPPDAPHLQRPPRRLLPPLRVNVAMAANRRRFGVEADVFPLWNLGRWDELAAIEAAVAAGEPFDPEATARAWDLRPGPGADA